MKPKYHKETYGGHLRINSQAEVFEVRILSPLKHTDTMVDGLNSLLWTGNSKLDHGSSLF